MDIEENEYGIKYKVTKVSNDKYLLFPVSLVTGESDAFVFTTTDGEKINIANYNKDLKNKYVVDRVFDLADLEAIFDYDYDGSDFLVKYYFEHFKDILIYVDVDLNNDILKKNEINVKDFTEREFDLSYFMEKKTPAIEKCRF